ncbi:MAG: hypothetical protein ACR2P2_02270 [Nakamurella sp.]
MSELPDAGSTGAEDGSTGPGAGSSGSDASGLGPLGDLQLLAGMLRTDHDDLPSYVRLLAGTLGEVLPAGMVDVDYDRSMGDRLAGRDGTPKRLVVHGADGDFELAAEKRGVTGQLRRTVNGVVIARKLINPAEWVQLLAQELSTVAARDRAARDALSQLFGG